MADLLKKAANFFGAAANRSNDDFIGSVCVINDWQIKVKKKIAEGGFAQVYLGQNVSTSSKVAIKRMLSKDDNDIAAIWYEVAIFKQLKGHSNIVNFVECIVRQMKYNQSLQEFLVLMEYCNGGEVLSIMQSRGKIFPVPTIIQIMYQTCRALDYMHTQNPPIIHRDLKVENLLVSESSIVKLCDFGSSTTEAHFPDQSWTPERRRTLEEEIEKKTTPMYRAPEMLDLFQNMAIYEAIDVWAFGCVFYLLCYNQHPFQEAAKLAILNASFTFPSRSEEYKPFRNIICQCFIINPDQRPRMTDISHELETISITREDVHPLAGPVMVDDVRLVDSRKPPPSQARPFVIRPTSNFPSPAPPPPPPPQPAPHTSGKTEPESNLYEPEYQWHPDYGARSLRPEPSAPEMRKSTFYPDVSNLLHTEQQHRPSSSNYERPLPPEPPKKPSAAASGPPLPPKGPLPSVKRPNVVPASQSTKLDCLPTPCVKLVYITSRLAVMLTSDDAELTAVESYLDSLHSVNFLIFNLTGQRYRPPNRFHGCTSQVNLKARLACLVEYVVEVLDWLNSDPNNIAIIHGVEGRHAAAWRSLVTAVLLSAKFCKDEKDAVTFLQQYELPHDSKLTSSQMRYLNYVTKLSKVPPELPHDRKVTLSHLEIMTVPLFNRSKSGCRPYVEIFQGEERFFSSAEEFDKMKVYSSEKPNIIIPLKSITLQGDVTIVLLHARSNIGGESTKVSSTTICQVHFHTGYLSPSIKTVEFDKSSIDLLAPSDRYLPDFCLYLNLSISTRDQMPFPHSQTTPWKSSVFINASKELLHPSLARSDTAQANEYPAGNDGVYSDLSDSDEQSNSISSETKKPEEFHPRCDTQQPPPFMGTSVHNEPADENHEHHEYQMPKHRSQFADFDSGNVGDARYIHLDQTFSSPTDNETTNNSFQQNHQSPAEDILLDLSGEANSNIRRDDPVFPKMNAQKSENYNLLINDDVDVDDLLGDTKSACPPSFSGWDPFDSSSASNMKRSQTANENIDLTGMSSSTTSSNQTTSQTSHNGESNMFGNRNPLFNSAGSIPNLYATSAGKAKQTADPFADFGNLKRPTETLNEMRSNSSSPYQNASNFESKKPPSAGYSTGSNVPPGFKPAPNPKPKFKPETKSSFTKNNTSGSSHFKTSQPNEPSSNTNSSSSSGPRKPPTFEDLFDDFKPPPSNSQPKTLSEIRREASVKDMDGDTIKVRDWTEGKRNNIRALLGTLKPILWEGVRWEGVTINNLITPENVKKQYKNVMRFVHPDKWMNTPYENLAKLIVFELNAAMVEFDKEKAVNPFAADQFAPCF